MSHTPEPQTIVDCKDAAESVGLSYASTDEPGIIIAPERAYTANLNIEITLLIFFRHS
jgi:hypothetical protein